MAGPIRWGILGTGKICRAFAAALRDTPDAVLAAVGSRELASASAFVAEFGGTAYGGYQALADAPDLDIVYIGTPHPLHADNALMLLHGGKAVLCEKPFTLNRRQAETVLATARDKRLFAMEAMWSRFLPAIDTMRRLIATGEIGDVRLVAAHLGFTADFGPEHRVYNPALGGGALLDLGIYPLSLAADLLGPIAAVHATGELGPTGVDIQTGFSLRHENGGVSVCSCSFSVQLLSELVVTGTRGRIRLGEPFHKAQALEITVDGATRRIEAPYLGNGYVHQAIEAGRCLRAGLLESPRMTHAQTLELMGVMDAIRGQIGVVYPGE
ncbi:MAG TPA: Gfo/Idh/MocA family oxidoreductase [Burkholderiaceae bacterium]